MVATDEDALVCDFAETYHILDFRALPARLAARLACGLRSSSRIKQKLSGAKEDIQTALLAHIADAVRMLVWMQSEDGSKGRNRPQSIAALLLGESNASQGFDSVDDFRAWRESVIGGDSDA